MGLLDNYLKNSTAEALLKDNKKIIRAWKEYLGTLEEKGKLISKLSQDNLDTKKLRKLLDTALIDISSEEILEEEKNIFSVIKSRDILVHHPYESFSNSVERFLKAAVEDPKVLAIKMTLYRTGDNSQLIPLLIHAADQEKQVVCLV